MQVIHLAGSALIGAGAAVATMYVAGMFDVDRGPASIPEQQAAIENAPNPDSEEVRLLHQRLVELERRQGRLMGGGTPHFDENEDDGITGEGEPQPERNLLAEALDEFAYFDRRVEAFEEQTVDSAWQREVEPTMVAVATRLIDGTDVTLKGIECRHSSCRLDFAAPNRHSLMDIQHSIASTHYGIDCRSLVVTHEHDASASEQSLTALLDCDRPSRP